MDLERQEMVSSQITVAAHVAKGLKDLDPLLELTFFSDRAEPRYGIKPGRWHVVRRNERTADTYYPITTDNGGYREPDWGVVEAMKQADTWSSDYELPSDNVEEENARLANQRAKQRDDLSEEIAANFKAAKRVPGDGGLERRLFGKGAAKLG